MRGKALTDSCVDPEAMGRHPTYATHAQMSAATTTTITADELAAEFGVAARTVRYWISRGLPARKAGRPPRWMIELEVAGPWIAANGSAAVGRGIGGLTMPARSDEPPAGKDDKDDKDDDEPVETGIKKHIDRLDLILEAFTDLVFNAKEFDPRLVSSIKSISTGLRRLELHRLEMRQAEAELMDRSDHVRILGTFARLVVDEVAAWARTTPDVVVDTLTEAGVKLKAKKVINALVHALEIQASILRTNITQAIEQATDIE